MNKIPFKIFKTKWMVVNILCYKFNMFQISDIWRLDSNIESKSLNNTYLNIIELLFLI